MIVVQGARLLQEMRAEGETTGAFAEGAPGPTAIAATWHGKQQGV